MNANVIEFYKKVRTDQGLIEALSEGKTAEEISAIAVKKAAELGITLQQDDVVGLGVACKGRHVGRTRPVGRRASIGPNQETARAR